MSICRWWVNNYPNHLGPHVLSGCFWRCSDEMWVWCFLQVIPSTTRIWANCDRISNRLFGSFWLNNIVGTEFLTEKVRSGNRWSKFTSWSGCQKLWLMLTIDWTVRRKHFWPKFRQPDTPSKSIAMEVAMENDHQNIFWPLFLLSFFGRNNILTEICNWSCDAPDFLTNLRPTIWLEGGACMLI